MAFSCKENADLRIKYRKFVLLSEDILGQETTIITKANVQQQTGSAQCGVYAIAFAFALANSQDPSTIKFSQSLMRKHLVDCLIKQEFSTFPEYCSKGSPFLYYLRS